jgi:hypothetical protein
MPRETKLPATLRPPMVPVMPVIDASVTRDDLQSLSTADLRRELSAALELTAQTLRRLAAIVRILEDRGEDLSDLRLGFLGYVRQVAHGQVAPEVVVRFAESPLLIRRVAALPMPDQVRLASGEPVDLVVIGPNGRPDTRRVDPLNLGRDQIVQVFSPTGIRDISEQILIVESRSQKPPKAKTGKTIVGKVTVDRERGGTEPDQRLGISRPDLSRIETGDRIPSWTRMVEIVTTLGLDPECVVPEFFAKAGKG